MLGVKSREADRVMIGSSQKQSFRREGVTSGQRYQYGVRVQPTRGLVSLWSNTAAVWSQSRRLSKAFPVQSPILFEPVPLVLQSRHEINKTRVLANVVQVGIYCKIRKARKPVVSRVFKPFD